MPAVLNPLSNRFFRVSLVVVCAVVTLDLIAILFYSRYFNYGAEGIELAALLRLSDGLPYMTKLPDIPWYVNQYSPYFYAIINAPIKALGLVSLQGVALCARLTILIAAAALLTCVRRSFRTAPLSSVSFVFVSAWFLLLFPANIVSVRPDYLAFLIEFIGFIAWRRTHNTNQWVFSKVAVAGGVFGCALAVKLNTVGVLAGLLIYEIINRRWKRALILAGASVISSCLFLVLSFRIWGTHALHDTFLALQNQMEPPAELASRFVMLVFYAAPLGLLAVSGLRYLGKVGYEAAVPLTYALTTSLAFATLQQVKAGAWYNYYYGAFALALMPASVGLDLVLVKGFQHRLLPFATLIAALVHAVWSFRVPVVIARDRLLNNYPFATAASWLQMEAPGGALYSDDPNALLYFRRRTLLGPDAEIILNLTPPLQRLLPQLRHNMSKTPYAVAVTTGPSCGHWRAGGAFLAETSHLTRLAAKFGWVCIFVPSTPRLDAHPPPI